MLEIMQHYSRPLAKRSLITKMVVALRFPLTSVMMFWKLGVFWEKGKGQSTRCLLFNWCHVGYWNNSWRLHQLDAKKPSSCRYITSRPEVLRTARIIRVARYMPELMILIKGLLVAARSVFFTLVLLLLVTYIFSYFETKRCVFWKPELVWSYNLTHYSKLTNCSQ